jgi:hypothetical protein
MIIIGLADGIDPGIAETDTLIGIDHQTDGDAEVESGIIVTGETIPMMLGHEGAARTLLTHGPVVEAKTIVASLQADQIASSRVRSVPFLSISVIMELILSRPPNQSLPRRRPRQRRRPSA